MNTIKQFFFLFILVVVCPAQNTEDTLNNAKAFAKNHWDTLQHFELINSQALKFVFGNKKIYHIIAFNPMSAISGPMFLNHAMVIENGNATFIEKEEDACNAITRQGITIATSQKAFILVKAFLDMMAYPECKSGPSCGTPNFSPRITILKNTWIVSIVINIGLVGDLWCRYKLCIGKKGALSIMSYKILKGHIEALD
jgi:hypothetical protein